MFYSIDFKKVLYLCIEFFMVLDFKVNKIDCREIINFFLHLSQAPRIPPFSPPSANRWLRRTCIFALSQQDGYHLVTSGLRPQHS